MVQWKNTAAEPEADFLFVQRLKPHRSLTKRNFHLLLMIFSGGSLFTSVPFVLLGAWPVAGFMGLDLALVYFAFRANFHAARAYEDLAVTHFEIVVAKVSAEGQRTEFRFNPAFVHLERVEHEEFGTQRLAFVSRGKSLEIASFLGPAQKAELAEGLTRALIEARRGPRYS
jgi:uncharacterized membrane protein